MRGSFVAMAFVLVAAMGSSGCGDDSPPDGGGSLRDGGTSGNNGGNRDASAGQAGRRSTPAGGRGSTAGSFAPTAGVSGGPTRAGAGGVAGDGSYWESCCRDNEFTSCYCQTPPCDFGSWGIKVCEDMTCRPGGVACPESISCYRDDEDYARSRSIDFEPLPGWARCCMRAETRLCWLPDDVECNYDEGVTYNDDGTCWRDDYDAGGL